MFKQISPLLFLTVSLSAGAADVTQWPDAYSRRNYTLGMSLSEFRSTRHPDQKEWPNAYPVCTDEPKAATYPFSADLNISSDWKGVGVVQCTFFYDISAMPRPFGAGLVLGGINSHTEFFFIPPSSGEEPRLFYITSGGPTENYDDLVLTFTEALGKPTSVKSERLQNKIGAEFNNTVTTWANKSSEIVVNRYGDTIHVFEVEHILTPLWNVFEKGLGHNRSENAKKL